MSELIAGIADFAGPLGPFREAVDLLPRMDAWVEGLGDSGVARLVALLADPPGDLGGASTVDFFDTLGELLCLAVRRRPDGAVERLTPLLTLPGARLYAVDALGCTGDPSAVPALRSLVPRDGEEREHIADALAELND